LFDPVYESGNHALKKGQYFIGSYESMGRRGGFIFRFYTYTMPAVLDELNCRREKILSDLS
jgi:hypothetical protein